MDHLLILGWHNVRGSWAFPSDPGTGQRGLRRQFEVLRRVANVVDLGDAVSDLAAGRPLPARSVAITFDDGYRDNLDLAVPLLEELGLPATFFLVPAFLDRSVIPWWERLAHAVFTSEQRDVEWEGVKWPLADHPRAAVYDDLAARMKLLGQADRLAAVAELVERLRVQPAPELETMFLDWDGAARLLRRGMTIGAHSWDHAILANESAESQAENLVRAKAALQTGLGVEADLLAYPNGTPGTFDGGTVAGAEAAGYRCAVTTVPGRNVASTPRFELHRQVLYPERGVNGFRPIVRQWLEHARRGRG